MTMQRGDYLRISRSLRTTRDATLKGLRSSESSTRIVVRTAFRNLAVDLARGLLSVNSRFHARMFLFDSLGENDGRLALVDLCALEPTWADQQDPTPGDTQ